MSEALMNLFVGWGVPERVADEAAVAALLAAIVAVCWLTYLLLRNYLLKLIHRLVLKTKITWDDALMEAGVFRYALRLVPLMMVSVALDSAFPVPGRIAFVKRLVAAGIALVAARALGAFLSALGDIYQQRQPAGRKPIRPFVQALLIVLYVVAAVFAVAALTGKSPWGLFGLMGGLTAVLLLVFKDTILGFVAGIQIGANDMVRVGDWIEMPKYGADGSVIEVTVNTVKVRNWDNTVSTLPTYALVSDAVKNWRGMSESAGRRIKRSVYLDMNSVRFVDDAMLERFRKMELLGDYVERKQREIEEDNRRRGVDLSTTSVNGRRQTNLGLFRAYLLEYLRRHPKINKDLTLIVRHLQPTPKGLPVEIYAFCSDKAWANYEAIQADVFDHVLAALPEFELRVFQEPTGRDIERLAER